MHPAVISFLLATAIANPMSEPKLRLTGSFASASQTCKVVQAAYTAAAGHRTLIYPPDIRSDHRMLDLNGTVPDYRARLALSAGEFEGLAQEQDRYNFPNFRPACEWKGGPGPAVDDEGHATFVTFTSPIFATTRRLAVVEVSFREKGIFGYGLICIVRRRHGDRKADCIRSWIT